MATVISISQNDVSPFLVDLGATVRNPRALMARIGTRVTRELREHFRKRNLEPASKAGWPKSGFWGQIRERTALADVSDDSATVVIADYRMRMRVEGGVIAAKNKKSLAFPIHPLAAGLRAGSDSSGEFSSFTATTGIELFPSPRNSETRGVLLGKRGDDVEAFYALRKRVRHPKDPQALPSEAEIRRWIAEESGDFLDEHSNTGGSLN